MHKYGTNQEFLQWKKAVHEGLLFSMLSKGSTKTRMVSEPVSIAGLSVKESHDAAVQKNSYKGRLCELISASLKSGGNAKSQENPASTLLLSSGNAGSCCMWMVSVLLRWIIIFFTNLQNPFRFPGAGEREGKIGSLYTGILDSFLSKLHSGRNDRDIHDRGE